MLWGIMASTSDQVRTFRAENYILRRINPAQGTALRTNS